MTKITENIKRMALECGFDRVGIARAQPLATEGERLKEWLEKGFNGEMAWMKREPEKRFDPSLIFPQAKSVIVVALNYYTPNEHPPELKSGKISRYAWGDDYHEIVREKLTNLLDKIKDAEPAAEGRICVDTAPVMEKSWAVRAGLGWIGKHTNLITKDLGSWVFIGEILVNLELEYEDAAIPDHCGTCTACIEACPTGAIVEPYVIDSRRCISYGTIELRTQELPAEIADGLEGWLYGCDICQDVCPWNRFQKPTDEKRFSPRKDETTVDPDTILAMSDAEYAERFRHSAIKRAKLAGLKRNAAALKSLS